MPTTIAPLGHSTQIGFWMAVSLVMRNMTGASIVACLAFAYSRWAIGGAGAKVVNWSFVLLMAGLPVYVWVVRS